MASDQDQPTSMFDWIQVRSPFVYWSQTPETVRMRVDIKHAQNPRILIEENKVVFHSIGHGAHGESEYHFELDLPHSINPKDSTYRVLDRDVDISLRKVEKGWWDKVTLAAKKPAWLKVDFDRWRSPDDEEVIPNDLLTDYPTTLDSLMKEEFGYKIENLRTVYLFMYNLFQFVMNLYILGVLTVRWMKDGTGAFHTAYDFVGSAFCYAQLLQCLEILHPLLGFTKTSVVPAFLQVIGRNTILYILIASEERMHSQPTVFFLFSIWSMGDIIRYPFYLLQLSNINFYPITWLRYSAWVLLYPAGIACEAVIIFTAIPLFVETGKYSVFLPNKWNATFYLPAVMRGYLLFGLIPIAYALLNNMKRGRAKALKTYKTPIRKSS